MLQTDCGQLRAEAVQLQVAGHGWLWRQLILDSFCLCVLQGGFWFRGRKTKLSQMLQRMRMRIHAQNTSIRWACTYVNFQCGRHATQERIHAALERFC